MRTEATHPCDACGGTGEIAEYGGSLTGPMRISIILCPVCLGAGRFPDRMPAADALADAETLRINARLGAVLTHGNSVINLARRTDWQAPTLVYGQAIEAARAAFRAVPGLREERLDLPLGHEYVGPNATDHITGDWCHRLGCGQPESAHLRIDWSK